MTTPLKSCHLPHAACAFSLALGLCLPWPLAAQTPAPATPPPSAAEPAPQQELEPQTETKPAKPMPRTHAEVHADAHAEAVAEANSPKARHRRLVENEILKLWRQYRDFRREETEGWVELSFYVTPEGKVEGLTLENQEHSSVILTEISERAVKNAKLPPTPPEVVAELPEKPGLPAGRLRCDLKFQIDSFVPKKPETPKEKPRQAAAVGPVFKYREQAAKVMYEEWHRQLEALPLLVMVNGERLTIRFELLPDGSVGEVMIVTGNDADDTLKNATLAAVRKAPYPPMPPEVAALLVESAGHKAGRLRIDANFVVPHDPAMGPELEEDTRSWRKGLSSQEPWKYYYGKAHGAVQQEWFRYHKSKERSELPTEEVKAVFRVKPDGVLDRVMILDKEPDFRVKTAVVAAIRAAKYPPMGPKLRALLAQNPAGARGLWLMGHFNSKAAQPSKEVKKQGRKESP